jgi:hypothetical protein
MGEDSCPLQKWRYLYKALDVDGAHRVELLFKPSINQNVYAVFF